LRAASAFSLTQTIASPVGSMNPFASRRLPGRLPTPPS
jgi:hypothetical protein